MPAHNSNEAQVHSQIQVFMRMHAFGRDALMNLLKKQYEKIEKRFIVISKKKIRSLPL